ncbi:DUF2141 domain-containing protein [Lacinutrix sp. 5H-3-7-4]|uniref:DUF2141 domain-containing protein n=1 Tax=Lacinutrix sp. (strain 5H-3-7-4) TaxID=983544 RepID=UPI00020A3429|nr:DUF2141 domain-containing protein [Lacinutrix sp. 5H-3-7-4]AEH01793.1 Protein of unknown function DUF2141 [Lacinutrix sp. 5H-3-7-4]
MKRSLLILAVLFSFQFITAQAQNITVNISNIDTYKGTLVIGLYDNESQFLKKTVKGKLKKVTKNTATVVFQEVEPGDYAVSLFHDVNDNKKLDTYVFGIPKEDYGTSNNAKGFMGPPKWEDAVFTVDSKNVTQNISL